jgi:hypothetical protein
MDLQHAIITDHAGAQMARREVAEEEVRAALGTPERMLDVRAGRVVVQAMSGRYLLRVFVDVDRDPPEVVTVYRTSKIDKYRSGS